MKRAAWIFCVLIIVCSFLSACERTEKTDLIVSETDGKTLKKENNEKPLNIRLALNHAKSINPYDKQEDVNLQAFRLIYEPLFDYSEKMETIPVLAEDWTVLDEGRAITVKIKDGIMFHNGKVLTANDVAESINYALESQNTYLKGDIILAEAQDEKNVLITFLKKQMNAEEKLIMPIVLKSDTGIFGTGPYKFDGKESADAFGFSVFSDYHGKKPMIEKIKMTDTPNLEAVVNLFEIGETDILTSDAFDYSAFKTDDEKNVYEYPINTMVYLGLNFDNSIFWGENTRQALLYVLDKNDIVTRGVYQKAQKADFPINPASWLYPEELGYKKDNMKAEALLSADSWTRNGGVYARMLDGVRQDFSIRMLAEADSKMKSVAEIVKKTFDNFGIKCELIIKPREEFDMCIHNKEYDVFIDEKTLSGSADFESLTGEGNVFGYSNAKLNGIVEKIRTERNEESLKQNYLECCKIFLKDVQFIPLFFCKEAMVTSGNVSDNVVPGLYNPFYNIAEWNR